MAIRINPNNEKAVEVCDCSCHMCCVPLDEACVDCEHHPWHEPSEHDE
jgi:hypothetical protein